MKDMLDYKKRLGRLDFWKVSICLFFVGVVLEGISRLVFKKTVIKLFYWQYLFLDTPLPYLILKWMMFILILLSFYFQFKRLLDTGLTRWLVVLNVIPYLSFIPTLICLFKKGIPED